MAPVAVTEKPNGTTNGVKARVPAQVFNPFYSPPAPEGDDKGYKYAQYKVISRHQVSVMTPR